MQIVDRFALLQIRKIHYVAMAAMVCIGIVIIVSRFSRLPQLGVLPPQIGQRHLVCAVAFLFAAVSLRLWRVPVSKHRVRTAQVCGGCVLLLGLLSLEYYLYWTFAAREASALTGAAPATLVAPARYNAFISSISLIFAGCALCVLDRRPRKGGSPSEWFALAAGIMPFTTVIGHLYSGRGLFNLVTNPISPATIALYITLGLFMLSIAIFTARPDRGWMARFTSDSPGGIIMRRLLPAGIVILVGLGAMTLTGRQNGLYRFQHEVPILVTLSALAFVLFLQHCMSAIARLESSRRKTEEKLQRSEERLRMAVEAARIGTWEIDLATNVVWWSETVDDMSGRSLDASDRRYERCLEIVHPEDREMVDTRVNRALTGAAECFRADYRILLPDKSVRWMAARGTVVRDEYGCPVRMVGTVMDITERKFLEGKLIEASNREQRRLGQDLHDDLGQWLTALHLEARALNMKLKSKSESDAAHAEKIVSWAREALERTQLLARGLVPAVIETGGLSAALEELAANTEKMFRVDCSCTCGDSLAGCDPEAALQLYRIAQEAISNALRHGKANSISVRLEPHGDGRVCLVVFDNGIGIPHPLPRSNGLGLRIMQYRAELVGANVDVRSEVGGGTKVVCSFSRELCDEDRLAAALIRPRQDLIDGEKAIESLAPAVH